MSSTKRILIVDDMHECILPLLKEAGFDPVYLPVIDRAGILEIISQFEGLVIRSKTAVDRELIDAGTNLKIVARAGAGMDKVDEEYLKEKGIKAINAPEGNRDALAEHTLGMLLALLHSIPSAHEEIRSGIWNREGNRGIELKGKVVGIYGVGNMGMSFASKLRSFDCEILGYDKFKGEFPGGFIKNVELDELMERTEILSIHVPLYDETRKLFDEAYLRRFKNLKVLLNTARGEILDTKALIKMLEAGSIYGAGLDVLENEKLDTYSDEEKAQLDKLLSMPNVLLTPHVGGWTYESYQRISEVIVEKIKED
ncbi:D-3-phosphoglycerate dehydrogenase [Ekhidna lutea]|uniref:D-3-phosphoglycerate dehydrogenase n=1 Tax=Ekhidna lutea TaxID=447679 RepID=A0A239HJT4_EKHLU|nr:NAD(P)-dependent oxidoreductase [Ekhidna lutea]SNS81656.1 D-3-phosphoglycerate dehydrogenase [Ekhidna lutea]